MAKVYDNATDLITFARGSSATYTGSDGTQQTAASDEPRIEYAADGTLKGLLIEEQRTNLLLNSDNPDTQVATLAAGSHTLSFVGGPSVTGISDTITANAVDVFVYDTSKDSDGGAWRTGSLAQASSWYAEASSASRDVNTRSTRAEFPAVAIIVAESDKVTIYDGDDPSLPMWMVFNQSASGFSNWNNEHYMLGTGAYSYSSVSAMNGSIVLGLPRASGTSNIFYNGITIVRFITDDNIAYGQTSTSDDLGGKQIWNGNISERNTLLAHSKLENDGLVNSVANNVAITVLPDAPTDPATGLPVPTIAVATDGGVSVIKDDGTVVDSSWSSDIGLVDFTSDNDLWYFRSSGSAHRGFLATLEDYSAGDGFGDQLADDRAGLEEFDLLTRSQKSAVFLDSFAIGGFSSATASAVPGLMLHQPNYTDQSKGMSALTTSSYNTGWMPGDIKLAALADTTAETFGDAVSGATVADPNGDNDFDGEHVTNGTFDNDISGWTASTGATVTHDTNRMKVTQGSSNDFVVAYQAITTVAGETYTVSYDVIDDGASSSAAIVYIRTHPTSGNIVVGAGGFGTNSATFTATSTTTYVSAGLGTASDNVYVLFDNISVRLADPDRSVNGNGLAVHGSITKTAVATGADVVAYSGFSTSNYLEQPYNPDLDFGQGDFCVMAWVTYKHGPNNFIIDRCDSLASTPDRWNLVLTASGIFQRCDSTGISISHTFSDGVRYFICGVRTGGVFYAYVDGVLVGSATQQGDQTDASQSYPLTVASFGGSNKGDAPIDIALLRISATAPTADQIAKIYNDELPLFQPNAKATLTGNSDAVTALAHDPDTDLLHVGTSGGRSVFYGLRRVNETATAVTTAISAVDGLIVEQ